MNRHLALLLPLSAFALFFGATAWQLGPVQGMPAQLLKAQESEYEKLQRLLEAARKLILIPDVNPFVGQVKNVTFLRTQFAFYDNTQEGDILIITQKQAIVYRPNVNRIVYAVSRNEAYGIHTPPGIRQLTPEAYAPTPAVPCTQQQTSTAPWKLQPVGSPAPKPKPVVTPTPSPSPTASASKSSKKSSTAGGWSVVP